MFSRILLSLILVSSIFAPPPPRPIEKIDWSNTFFGPKDKLAKQNKCTQETFKKIEADLALCTAKCFEGENKLWSCPQTNCLRPCYNSAQNYGQSNRNRCSGQIVQWRQPYLNWFCGFGKGRWLGDVSKHPNEFCRIKDEVYQKEKYAEFKSCEAKIDLEHNWECDRARSKKDCMKTYIGALNKFRRECTQDSQYDHPTHYWGPQYCLNLQNKGKWMGALKDHPIPICRENLKTFTPGFEQKVKECQDKAEKEVFYKCMLQRAKKDCEKLDTKLYEYKLKCTSDPKEVDMPSWDCQNVQPTNDQYVGPKSQHPILICRMTKTEIHNQIQGDYKTCREEAMKENYECRRARKELNCYRKNQNEQYNYRRQCDHSFYSAVPYFHLPNHCHNGAKGKWLSDEEEPEESEEPEEDIPKVQVEQVHKRS